MIDHSEPGDAEANEQEDRLYDALHEASQRSRQRNRPAIYCEACECELEPGVTRCPACSGPLPVDAPWS